MRRIALTLIAATALTLILVSGTPARAEGPYKVLSTTKAGGEGGFDYVYADSAARKLYVPRGGTAGVVTVYDLDSLKQVGSIAATGGHGVAVDENTHHAFVSSKPVVMWDSKTLVPIRNIDVDGGPDGIFGDAFNGRVYVFSHRAPNATILDAKDGSVIGTIELGGAPEQAVSDGKGHLFVDIEDKGNIAVVDVNTLTVTAHYDLAGKGGTCAGLAIDLKNNILFATCRDPQTMVILSAADGKILATLPIGSGTDGAVFNPATKEVFSAQGDGTLTIVKEESPTKFVVEQTLTTMPRAKTLALDTKTGHILLISAEFTPPPPAAPGERPGRGTMVPGSFSILTVGK